MSHSVTADEWLAILRAVAALRDTEPTDGEEADLT